MSSLQNNTVIQNVPNQWYTSITLRNLNMILNDQIKAELTSQGVENSGLVEAMTLNQNLLTPIDWLSSMGFVYQPSLWALDLPLLKQCINLFYCTWEEQNYETPKYDTSPKIILSSKDVEVIQKLSEVHLSEHLKSKAMVLNQIKNITDGNQTVFQAKSKGCKNSQDTRNFRGSKYRGVSMNGKSWQVFIVINKVKCYAGCVSTEKQAAALYDKLAIVFHGTKVRDI